MEGFSKDNIVKIFKIIFSENGLHSKIVSDVGTNFIQRNLKTSAGKLLYITWYHHYITIKAEALHKICQKNYEKSYGIIGYIYMCVCVCVLQISQHQSAQTCEAQNTPV